jgi:hypothetical protein
MKYVSILIPEPGPLGDIFFDASVRAMVVALFVNKPAVGRVESVLTLDIHRFVFLVAIGTFLCKARCELRAVAFEH